MLGGGMAVTALGVASCSSRATSKEAGRAGSQAAEKSRPVMAASERTVQPSNRLSREQSPYLLQHAHNPVDWYPWGAEAVAKARRE